MSCSRLFHSTPPRKALVEGRRGSMSRGCFQLQYGLGYFPSCMICSSSRAAAELTLDITHCILFDISSNQLSGLSFRLFPRCTFCSNLINDRWLCVLSLREWPDQGTSVALHINPPSGVPHTRLEYFVLLILHSSLSKRTRPWSLHFDVVPAPLPSLIPVWPALIVLPVPVGLRGDLIRALDPELPGDEDLLNLLRDDWPKDGDRGQNCGEPVFRLAEDKYAGKVERQILVQTLTLQDLVGSEAQAGNYINTCSICVSPLRYACIMSLPMVRVYLHDAQAE